MVLEPDWGWGGGMEESDESLYRDGPVVRARPSGQTVIHAPKPERAPAEKRAPAERPRPVTRNRAAPPPQDETVEVFVTRLSAHLFSWQIRRYGALVVREGPQTYTTAQLAREAGEAAMKSPARVDV